MFGPGRIFYLLSPLLYYQHLAQRLTQCVSNRSLSKCYLAKPTKFVQHNFIDADRRHETLGQKWTVY